MKRIVVSLVLTLLIALGVAFSAESAEAGDNSRTSGIGWCAGC